jgi:hypothetical protein
VIGVELPVTTGVEAARLIGALGRHRYVTGRAHLVHALVYRALGDELDEGLMGRLAEGRAWADRALGSGVIAVGSRDERLWRKATEDEVGALLEVYWATAPGGRAAKGRLASALAGIDATVDLTPFDEDVDEGGIFPILIDCGWELHPLGALIEERHKGAIDSFGDPFSFLVAKFEEVARGDGGEPPVYLQELTALGPAELLRGVDDDGHLVATLTLWNQGPEPYLDYVLRGALKSARLLGAAT